VVAGNHAYIADQLFFDVIDISNPISPPITTTVSIAASSVEIAGSYAYVLHSTSLRVLDISNPASPQTVSVLSISFCWDLALAGSYAYVTVSSGALLVVDISNPASPFVAGSVGLGTIGLPTHVVAAGSYAYVTVSQFGMRVVDVSNPASPVIVGSIQTPGVAEAVAVDGTYAYVAAGTQGLQIVNVSNPASPVIVGSLDTPGNARGIAVDGTNAYITDNADYANFLRMVNVSNPQQPIAVGARSIPSGGDDITIDGQFAYVCSSDLMAVDLSQFAIVGSGGLPSGPTDVAVAGDHVYATLGNTGFLILPAHCPATTAVPSPAASPIASSRLGQNRPNPFDPASGPTAIHFALPGATRARLQMFDVSGRRVRVLLDQVLTAGEHAAAWDGRNDRGETVAAGVYFYRLEIGEAGEAGDPAATRALVKVR
jgi:hypothetical protein